MNPQDAVDFLNDCVKWINTSAEDIQGGEKLAKGIEKAIKEGKAQEMVEKIEEMAEPLKGDYLKALGNSEVFNGVKETAGKTADVVFSPTALSGVKIAAATIAGGPIGAAIAIAAVAGTASAAAYDINRLNVLHDEACHLNEYAKYKKTKDKLVEDITLQCQVNDPRVTEEEVKTVLKETGILDHETKQANKSKSSTENPKEVQSEFKEVMAKNLAINSVILLAAQNPAAFLSLADPIGAGIEAGVTVARTIAQSATDMSEEKASQSTISIIEERRNTGPEKYKKHNDIDPGSLEYQGNVAKNKIRRLIGVEETDPGKSEVSRKYDLAEAALRERVSTETLNDLSQDSAFIGKITNSVQMQRQDSNIDLPKDLEDQITTKERELIEFKNKEKELIIIENKLKEYGPDPTEILALHEEDRIAIQNKIINIIEQSSDIDIAPEKQAALSNEAFLLQNEMYNIIAEDEKLKASIIRREELKEYFSQQPSTIKEKEKEIEDLKKNITQQLNPQLQSLTKAEERVQYHIAQSPNAENYLAEYKNNTSEDKIKYDKLDSLIKEQKKLEEYSLVLNERQKELLASPTKNSDKIAKNAKALKKNEQKVMELEQDLLEHATLASYKQNIQDNNRKIIETTEKLESSDSPSEQDRENISSLQAKTREDAKKHDELESSIIYRDKLKIASQENHSHLQGKMMDASIQEKKTELRRKDEKLKKIEDRIKKEGGLSDYHLKTENYLTPSYYKDAMEREIKELENIKKRIEEGKESRPNETSLKDKAHNAQQNISEYREHHRNVGPLLESREYLQESLKELSSEIDQLKNERKDINLSSPKEALKDDLIKQQMELRGTHFDKAKESGLYTSEQLKKDTYLTTTEDGKQVTKTDYSKWAESSGRNLGKAFTTRENEQSTYEAIQKHDADFSEHITQQNDQINASIANSKQKIIDSLASEIVKKETPPKDLIERINKLDKETFNLKINGKTLVEHLEEKGAEPTVLETIRTKDSRYKQEDLEQEQQANMDSLIKMVNDPETTEKDLIDKINELDKETLNIKVDDKSLIEHIEEKQLSPEVLNAAIVKSGLQDKRKEQEVLQEKTPQEIEEEQKKLEEKENKKKTEKEEQTKSQQKEMDTLVDMLNNYSKDGKMTSLSESEKMAEYIKTMDKEALKLPVNGKDGKTSFIELIAAKNAGSHVMAAALKKDVFTKEQIVSATKKLKDKKESGQGIMQAARSWKRRSTTAKKLRDTLVKQEDKTPKSVSSPIMKGIARNMRVL